MQRLITTKARSAARKWSGLRIPASEFESVFWETAWNLADNHELKSNFLLYETIELSIKHRTIDVARKFGRNKQNRFELQAVSLDYLSRGVPDIRVDVSEQVTDRLFVQQLLTDPSILNSEERELLLIRFDHPEATFRDLASSIGYSKDKVSRVIARCDAKVRQECPDLFHYVSYYSTGKKNRFSGFSSFKTDTEIRESKTVETPVTESPVEKLSE